MPKDRMKTLAEKNLESAGAYGRTIERWWNGFYTDGKAPTVEETANMEVDEIVALITKGSQRG